MESSVFDVVGLFRPENHWHLVSFWMLAAGSAVTGWLGGELVDRLGVGVDPGAGLDAPSSLRRPSL